MIKSMMHAATRNLERMFGYDASYIHEVIDASQAAGLKFMLSQMMGQHCEGVSKDAWYSAKLAAALSEDCGSCTQLCVDMAVRAGVSPQKVAALICGDIEQAGEDAAFGYRYGMAVSTNSAESISLVEEATKRFGEKGKVSLALVVAATRVYPALKRGLGHGAVCAKIDIADQSIVVRRAA